MIMAKYIAIDQYGEKVLIKEHPRKELCEWAGTSHADKMYCDDNAGNTYHVGYVIARHWFNVLGLEGQTFIKEV